MRDAAGSPGRDAPGLATKAAVVAELDLIVTVDTGTAHLAGALGRPVWLMLPRVAEWRWIEGRTDSPWYPTMQIYCQEVLGKWEPVVGRVAEDLAGLARRYSDSPAPTLMHRSTMSGSVTEST
jgi:hypothetical protein